MSDAHGSDPAGSDPAGSDPGGSHTTAPDAAASDAVAYLLRLLSRRDYAEAELDQRLRRKGFDDEACRAALDRIRDLDLIDDARVAEMHVRSHAHRKGRLALRRDLRARGLGDTVVTDVLEPLDDAQQLAAARGVIDKQRWRFASDDPRKNRAKAGSFLARRGFAGDVVSAALEAEFDGADERIDESAEDDAADAAPQRDFDR